MISTKTEFKCKVHLALNIQNALIEQLGLTSSEAKAIATEKATDIIRAVQALKFAKEALEEIKGQER